MSTIFTGLGQLFVKTPARSNADPGNVGAPFPAIVLDVVLSEDDEFYNSIEDIGKIRIKPAEGGSRTPDQDLRIFAYPSDRRSLTYPLPGEQVFVCYGMSDRVDDYGIPVPMLIYQNLITQNNSVTYNVLPTIGSKLSYTTPPLGDFGVLETNQAKLKNAFTYFGTEANQDINITAPRVKERPVLQPYEGDTIYQGRFGQSIRFSSTQTNAKVTSWSEQGVSGNPITILRVHDQIEEDKFSTTENINTDNTSIYLTSTQKVDLNLSCGKNMYSWATTYKLQPPTPQAVSAGSINSNPDTSTVYQKVVDMQAPISQSYSTPTNT